MFENAENLTSYLQEEFDFEGTYIGLLDALASCGLKLVEDETGESSLAYQEAIKRETVR